tara:strand:- start:3753 stop:4085 length:333 start_codon:yes stop_codon:yes gene_type:complete
MADDKEKIVQKNTVRIDGADFDVDSLPNVAKIAIEHLVSIDKEVQRLEMARAGFAQAIKSVMDGPEAPEPVSGVRNSTKTPADTKADGNSKGKPTLEVVPEKVADGSATE